MARRSEEGSCRTFIVLIACFSHLHMTSLVTYARRNFDPNWTRRWYQRSFSRLNTECCEKRSDECVSNCNIRRGQTAIKETIQYRRWNWDAYLCKLCCRNGGDDNVRTSRRTEKSFSERVNHGRSENINCEICGRNSEKGRNRLSDERMDASLAKTGTQHSPHICFLGEAEILLRSVVICALILMILHPFCDSVGKLR